MNATVQPIAAASPRARIETGIVRIAGRIRAVKQLTGDRKGFATQVSLPAPDAYTAPGLVEVRSTQRLGKAEDDIDVSARVGGYLGKPVKRTDNDGVITTDRYVSNTFDVVEQH